MCYYYYYHYYYSLALGYVLSRGLEGEELLLCVLTVPLTTGVVQHFT